jgi:hypothetical protein
MFLVGAFLISTSLFLYGDEENRLGNRLVDLWIGVTLVGERAEELVGEFIRRAAALANAQLNWLLGPSFLSVRFVTASSWISLSSTYLMWCYANRIHDARVWAVPALRTNVIIQYTHGVVSFAGLYSLFALFIALVIVPKLGNSWPRCALLIAILPMSIALYNSLCLMFLAHLNHVHARFLHTLLHAFATRYDPTMFVCVVVALGVISDLIILSLTRHLLRLMIGGRKLRSLMVYLAMNFLVSAFLLFEFLAFLFEQGLVPYIFGRVYTSYTISLLNNSRPFAVSPQWAVQTFWLSF